MKHNMKTIKRSYVRHYSDNHQTTAYIEWSDNNRTEGDLANPHIQALFGRAEREGLKIERETW